MSEFPKLLMVAMDKGGALSLTPELEQTILGATTYIRIDLANKPQERVDEMNHRLEGYLSAYPEHMFTPFTNIEKDKVMLALKYCKVKAASDRLHAEWVRHIALSIKEALKKD